MKTFIAAKLRAAGKAQLDEAFKRLLSEKYILAWIMRSCMEEYCGSRPQLIVERYIEGTPQVEEEPVYPDEAPRIHRMSHKDSSMHEGTVRFTALTRSIGEPIRLIINLGVLNSYYPGYPIVTRALYNCNRLISSQYEGCYEKIKKVYSIWICTNPPENRKNCIYRYRIAENLFAGRTNVMEERHHYDMLTALIFCLGQPEDRKVNNALDLLNSLFSERLTAKQKIKKLKEYDIPITQQLTEEVSLICSLSQENEERGIQKGIEKGIRGAIDICRKLNLPEEEILRQIMQQYELSEDTAREYLQKEE